MDEKLDELREKLTAKQLAWADYFIECGNKTEAARRAGYNPKSAREMGSENSTKPAVKAYIDARMEKLEAERVASADEVMRFYSAVMRGEVKDQFGLEASLADRLKAGDSLMKRFAAGAGFKKQEKAENDALTKSLKELAAEMEAENADQ